MKSNDLCGGRTNAYAMKCRLPFYSTMALMTCLLLCQLSFRAVAQSTADDQPAADDVHAPAAEEDGQSLSPELEMAIIRQLNLEDRIANRQAVLPKRAEGQDGDADVSGEWICFTTMFLNGPTGRGIMYLNLKQDGDAITGINGQLKHPFDPPSTIRPVTERTTRGLIKGKWYMGSRTHMMVLERQRISTSSSMAPAQTWAIFTAVIAGDGKTATGQLVNNGGNYGTMLMGKASTARGGGFGISPEGMK